MAKVAAKTRTPKPRRKPSLAHRLTAPLWLLIGRIARIAVFAAAALAIASTLWVLAYRVIDPPGGYYMLAERLRLNGVAKEWRDFDQIAPHLARSAMAAEDAHFCDHNGFDLAAIEAAFTENAEGKRLRGGSTISQQVAKNVFLWPQRSWLRKGMEAGFTLLIEGLWPKRRILEVYLNVAEFDAGIFGAEAAARHYFGRSAAELSLTQSSRLAAILPAPKTRSASRPGNWTNRRARSIAGGAQTLRQSGRADCVFPSSKG